MFRFPLTAPLWVWKHRIAFWIVAMNSAWTQSDIAANQAAKAMSEFAKAFKDAGIELEESDDEDR